MLRKGKGKSIVNISSINYRLGIPGRSIYSTTKSGIIGLTTGLTKEIGKEGIRINCISPGWIFTEPELAYFRCQVPFYEVLDITQGVSGY